MPKRSTIQPLGLRRPMNWRERMTRPPMRRVQSSPVPEAANSTTIGASSVAAGSWNSHAASRPASVCAPMTVQRPFQCDGPASCSAWPARDWRS
jgi:hypothetical protein